MFYYIGLGPHQDIYKNYMFLVLCEHYTLYLTLFNNILYMEEVVINVLNNIMNKNRKDQITSSL